MDQSDITTRDLVALFCKSVGEEKAGEIIARALTDLGLKGHVFSLKTGLNVLSKVGESPGLVGIVARCASAKMMVKSR